MEQEGKKISGYVKRGLQVRIKSLNAKLENLQYEMDHKRDDVVDFGQMGIDHILVDESHYFKNLMFTTRHDRVAGLGNPTGSQRATNLLFAIRTLQDRKKADLQASFFSGTTISNSLTEQYLLSKYMTPYKLERQGLHCFDAWAALFAIKTMNYEYNVTNQIVAKERFRFFKNVPELANDYACFTDYRTAKDIGIDRPEVDEILVNIPQTRDQRQFAQNLIQFAKNGDATLLGREKLNDKERKARMLIATNYANKMALDMRLISPAYGDDPNNKASRCAAKIAENYYKFDKWKGTQLVFTDLGTYKPDEWNVCSEIKRKLVEDYGIPADEIRFTQECKTREESRKMQADTKDGKIRVLFGSTKKLGTGVNVQDRVVAMHHLDIP